MELTLAEIQAALTARVTSARPFVERLVAFWSNHLCVSASAKLLVAPLSGAYEREAIRPHVLGRFEDMVLASARHPAMLYRGEVVWGRTKKRDSWGRRKESDRPANEWVVTKVEHLRVVSDELWAAAHEALRGKRKAFGFKDGSPRPAGAPPLAHGARRPAGLHARDAATGIAAAEGPRPAPSLRLRIQGRGIAL